MQSLSQQKDRFGVFWRVLGWYYSLVNKKVPGCPQHSVLTWNKPTQILTIIQFIMKDG